MGERTEISTTEASTTPKYTVTDYLLDRLVELGVDRVFGVPGDFTLGMLDHVDSHPGLDWVGTANELGAGYAADGYARVRGLGVLCTTFGVGELSALNAVAGSYAEHVPVLHVVGSPTVAVQRAGRATHHSWGDGDFGHSMRISAEVSVDQAMLTAEDACAAIDRVLGSVVRSGRPGYLSVPSDVGELSVLPPSAALQIPEAVSDPESLERFRDAATEAIAAAQSAPVVLADVLVHRAGAESELHRLLDSGKLQYSSLLWGRRVIDESGSGYLGPYIGAASAPEVREAIEGAPVLITAGAYFTDLISGFFSQHLDGGTRIDVLTHRAQIGDRTFAGVHMRDALDVLTAVVEATGPFPSANPRVSDSINDAQHDVSEDPLTQDQLWRTVAAALRPGDTVLADQGTAFYGMGVQRLPHDTLFIGQPLWASIGYTLPALLGASLAAPFRRPVLLIGDGAAQLTIAELGTIARWGIPAVIVVVNNDGYTVERAIHGATERYNDIAPWDWTALPAAMGAPEGSHQSFTARTSAELAAALSAAAEQPDLLTLIEAVTDPQDVPALLRDLARAAAAANAAS